MRGFGKCGPGAESYESRYFPAVDKNRDIFAGETDFLGAFLFIELAFQTRQLINLRGVYGGAGGIKNCYN